MIIKKIKVLQGRRRQNSEALCDLWDIIRIVVLKVNLSDNINDVKLSMKAVVDFLHRRRE
jgi:hypothetical protein